MKKIFMMLGIASMITLISSCTSDPCEGKTAIELCSGKGTLADKNGTCVCNCDAGYTGTKCETLISGNYIAVDKLQTVNQTGYNANISISGNMVTIANFTPFFFGGATKSVTGSIDGNIITIPAQNGGVSGGGTIGGTGTVSVTNSVITIKWTGKATISGVDLNWDASWTK